MNFRSLPEPTESEIRRQAYLLYVAGGRVPGHDMEHWLAAKEQLRRRARTPRAWSNERQDGESSITFPPCAWAQRVPSTPRRGRR
jgi:hypothetical protein